MASGSTAPFSGDHEDLENVQDGQHHAAATPDGVTIQRNNNGNLENVDEIVVIGDFENGLGDWNKQGNLGDFDRKSSFSNGSFPNKNGTFAFEMAGSFFDSDSATFSRDFDFTGRKTLKFEAHNDFNNGQASCELKIGNTTEVPDVIPSNEGENESFEIDVSGHSGTKTIEFNYSSNSNATRRVQIDFIRFENGGVINKTTDKGSGGTV